MKKIVLALGGNALGSTPEEQREAVKTTAKSIVDLVEAGNKIIISHGNGPQVGMINLAMDTASKSEAKTPAMPFPECGAMSQGYIGYHLQNAIENELKNRKIEKNVATIVSQVLEDKNDPAFANPTKPIGSFYTEAEAKAMEKDGLVFKEDAGRGYRRVVPSPRPVDLVEKDAIKLLYDNDCIVIAGGGGGIPVVEEDGRLQGVPAVIDKDFTSAKIAQLVDADTLIILTAVDQVAINFGKVNEKWLDEITIDQAKEFIEEGHFAPGSMLPKVQAAISFAETKEGRQTLITSLEKAADGLQGKTGTIIKK